MTFTGLNPIRPTVLKVGAGGAILGAANALASAIIWQMRSGEGQDIHVDLRKAYTIQSPYQKGVSHCTTLNGVSVMVNPNQYGSGVQILPTKDGRFCCMGCPYPSQILRAHKLLNCGTSTDQLHQASRKWEAKALEAAAANTMVPIHVIRTQKEFQATEHWEYHA